MGSGLFWTFVYRILITGYVGAFILVKASHYAQKNKRLFTAMAAGGATLLYLCAFYSLDFAGILPLPHLRDLTIAWTSFSLFVSFYFVVVFARI